MEILACLRWSFLQGQAVCLTPGHYGSLQWPPAPEAILVRDCLPGSVGSVGHTPAVSVGYRREGRWRAPSEGSEARAATSEENRGLVKDVVQSITQVKLWSSTDFRSSKLISTWFWDSGGSCLKESPALISEVMASAPHSLIRALGCWQTWRENCTIGFMFFFNISIFSFDFVVKYDTFFKDFMRFTY